MRSGGRGERFFISPGIPHSQSVCFVFWPKGGRGRREGFKNGLFFNSRECSMAYMGVVVYLLTRVALNFEAISLVALVIISEIGICQN